MGLRDHSIGEFLLADASVHDAGGACVVDAEFPFETCAGRPLAGQLEDKRMDLEIDAFDIVGKQVTFIPQLDAAVDARMDHDSAGEWFVSIERNLESPSQFIGDFVPVAFGRICLREPPRGLDRLLGCCVSVLRHQRRNEARACRRADMQRLGHRAELFAYADRL